MSGRHDLDQTQSGRRAYAVTPHDTNLLNPTARGLYIGTAGTLRVTHVDDSDPVDYPVTIAGAIYPIAVKRVHSTGTTATDIIALI